MEVSKVFRPVKRLMNVISRSLRFESVHGEAARRIADENIRIAKRNDLDRQMDFLFADTHEIIEDVRHQTSRNPGSFGPA